MMKTTILLPIMFCLVHLPFIHAQQDSSALNRQIDSVVKQTITLATDTIPSQTLETDNSEAINLMIQSNMASLEASLKESILAELIQNTENSRQRRELERQMDEIRQGDSLRRVMQQQRIDSLKKTAIGAPVTLKQDTLYFIYTNIGSISASERAKLHSEKILNTAKLFTLKIDSIHIEEGFSTSDIVYGTTVIASVTENDALWMNTTRDSLAEKHIASIVSAVEVYKKKSGQWAIIRIISLCLLLVIALSGLFFFVRYLFNHVLRRALIRRKDKLLKDIVFRDYAIMKTHQELKLLFGFLKIVKYTIYIILLYIALPLLFSIFPPTRNIAEMLFDWVLNPVKSLFSSFVDFLPDLFKIVVILIVVHYILKFIKYIAIEIEEKRLVIPGFYPDWAKATLNIIRIIMYSISIVMIYQLLPWASSPIFQGVSVFIGLLVSLGSTSVISNLMAGMVITYMRPFIQGDRIRIGDTYGDIVEKTPFVIRILTPKNEIITVPNATVLSSNVINYSAKTKDDTDPGVVVHTTVTLGYEVSWVQVHQLLIDAALKTPFIQQTPKPFVLQTALNDFSISYQINAYTKEPSKIPIINSELFKSIQDTFRDAGIELLTPHYQAYRDGNAITLPPIPPKPSLNQ